jgi:hypothetical protein
VENSVWLTYTAGGAERGSAAAEKERSDGQRAAACSALGRGRNSRLEVGPVPAALVPAEVKKQPRNTRPFSPPFVFLSRAASLPG